MAETVSSNALTVRRLGPGCQSWATRRQQLAGEAVLGCAQVARVLACLLLVGAFHTRCCVCHPSQNWGGGVCPCSGPWFPGDRDPPASLVRLTQEEASPLLGPGQGPELEAVATVP